MGDGRAGGGGVVRKLLLGIERMSLRIKRETRFKNKNEKQSDQDKIYVNLMRTVIDANERDNVRLGNSGTYVCVCVRSRVCAFLCLLVLVTL